MLMFNFKLNPLNKTAVFLFAYVIIALSIRYSLDFCQQFLLIFISAAFIYYAFSYVSSKKKLFANALITTSIVFLLLSPGEASLDFLYGFFAIFIALFIKFFIEYKNMHPINPTVGALLILVGIASFFQLTEPFISWWGASFSGYWSLVFLIPVLLCILVKLKRYPIFLSFLFVYLFLQYFFFSGAEMVYFYLTTGTLYFMGAIMLTDPKTSPSPVKEQILFGMATALMFTALQYYNVSYSELISIGVVNILYFSSRVLKKS